MATKPLQFINADGNKTMTIYQLQKAIKQVQFEAVKLGSKLTAMLSSFPASHLSPELNGDVDVGNKEQGDDDEQWEVPAETTGSPNLKWARQCELPL